MSKYFFSIIFFCIFLENLLFSENQNISYEPGKVLFIPPSGWASVDPQLLSSQMKFMCIDPNATSSPPPSINLTVEKFEGSLENYKKIIFEINARERLSVTDLGTFSIDKNLGVLLRVDHPYSWGTLRMLHLVTIFQGYVYILTASTPKEDFVRVYPIFMESFKNFHIMQDPIDILPTEKQRILLRKLIKKSSTKKQTWSEWECELKEIYSEGEVGWFLAIKRLLKNQEFD